MPYSDLILERKSPYQTIRILQERETKKIRLSLNGYIQFVSGSDDILYHEALLFPVRDKLRTAKNLLILGGGTGNILRDVWRINSKLEVTLVDIDKEIIDLAMSDPLLLKVNKDSFHKGNCHIIIQDALKWAKEASPESFELAVLDFPDPNSFELKPLFEEPFFKDIHKILAKDAIIATQAGRNWCATYLAIEQAFKHCHIHEYEMPTLGKGIICWSKKCLTN